MKRYGTNLLVIVYALTFNVLLYSQDNTESIQRISIKSPEVAAFERLGEIPVDIYTGVPQISIPIYTVRSGDVELPITLDYHAVAIKVDQEATWVGLNWLLNAGGAISTQISGYYQSDTPQADWEKLFNGGILLTSMGYNPDIEQTYKWGQKGKNLFKKCNTENWEDDISYKLYKEILLYNNGEAQLFSANFAGKSFKFIYHRLQNKFIVVGKDQKVIISGWPGSVATIKDEKGFSYAFSQHEDNVLLNSSLGDMYAANQYASWSVSRYLTGITSPSGRSIGLRYTQYSGTEGIQPLPKITQQSFYNYPRKSYSIDTKLSPSMRINHSYLSEIESDDAIVKFYTSNRLDLDKGKKLDSICVYEKATNRLFKKVIFNYDYFGENTTGGNILYDMYNRSNQLTTYYTFYSDNRIYKRLKLVSVQEYVRNSSNILEKKPAYTFTYCSPSLPAKTSAAVDYWGFYNGQENSAPANINNQYAHTLIPAPVQTGGDQINEFPYSTNFTRANRKFNPATVQACMLQIIKYPTGATATFTYEPHEFNNFQYPDVSSSSSPSKGAGVRIKSINVSDGPKINYKYLTKTGNSSGILMSPLKFGREKVVVFQGNEYSGTPLPSAKFIDYWLQTSENQIPVYENRIGYSRVCIQNGTSNGETVYEYWNNRTVPVNIYFKPLEDPRNGNLLKKSVYHASGRLVTVDSITYSVLKKESYFINAVIEDFYNGPDDCYGGSLYSLPHNPFAPACVWRTNIYIYPSVKYWIEMTNKTVKTYDDSGNMTTEETNYTYNPANLSVASISKKLSNNDLDLTYYVYPTDYQSSSTVYPGKLVEKNILTYPLEIVRGVKKGSNFSVTHGFINKYNDYGNVTENYRLEIAAPVALSSFRFSNKNGNGILPESSSNTATYSPYSSYALDVAATYIKGNPVSIVERDANKVAYIWSYAYQYPIAEVKNATYAEVKAALGYTDAQMETLAAQANPDVNWVDTKLRAYFGTRTALVTTYTYRPLVGILTAKDPRGVVTTYNYDAFGRLQSVVDGNGKTVETYDYHYKN
ncbi:MAG: RHS repeat protein [Dysgonamonadaceae bacterium]|jgi:YD repeat-containing protein|nr:RHS repeat protein [Dysgonamonadaceae bacterium]